MNSVHSVITPYKKLMGLKYMHFQTPLTSLVMVDMCTLFVGHAQIHVTPLHKVIQSGVIPKHLHVRSRVGPLFQMVQSEEVHPVGRGLSAVAHDD